MGMAKRKRDIIEDIRNMSLILILKMTSKILILKILKMARRKRDAIEKSMMILKMARRKRESTEEVDIIEEAESMMNSKMARRREDIIVITEDIESMFGPPLKLNTDLNSNKLHFI